MLETLKGSGHGYKQVYVNINHSAYYYSNFELKTLMSITFTYEEFATSKKWRFNFWTQNIVLISGGYVTFFHKKRQIVRPERLERSHPK